MILIHGFDSSCIFKGMYLVILFYSFLLFYVSAFCSDYSGSSGGGAVMLDDCNFHESVRLDNFDIDRTLTLVSPSESGEICNFWSLYTYVRHKFNLSYYYRYHQMVNFL